MEERRTPNKTLIVIGFLVSILFIGLGGLVLFDLLLGGMDFELDIFLLTAMLVVLGLTILVCCISSLIGKKTIDAIDMFLIFFIITGVMGVLLGISENMVVPVLVCPFLAVPFTVLFIQIKRNQALIKKYGDKAKEIFEKKKKRGKLKVILTLVATLIIAVSLAVAFVEPESKSRGICGSCDREYTDSDNKHSIAKTGMCKNCYGNFKNFEQFIDR